MLRNDSHNSEEDNNEVGTTKDFIRGGYSSICVDIYRGILLDQTKKPGRLLEIKS